MGGLGSVTLAPGSPFPDCPFLVSVSAADPVLACLASQYAGWSLSHGDGDDAYFAMASGPGRARAAKEALFEELGYTDTEAFWGFFVLETDRAPPDELIARVASDCGLAPAAMTFILTPTTSLAGAVQITARVLEVALHKVHTLGFPWITCATGWAAPRCRHLRPIFSPPWGGPTTRSCSAARCSCS